MLSELQNQLKQKQADIELAASVGQALLEEIDFLKKKLNERNSIVQERKFSTPKSSRQLKQYSIPLESPSKDSKEMLDQMQVLKVENQTLLKKNEKLIKQCDVINESCWNLEIENQNLNESLKNQKVNLDKSLDFSKNLQVSEKKLRMERDNYQSLYESLISRNKELENLLSNFKKREAIEVVEADVKDIVQYRSVTVQVDQETSSDSKSYQSKNEILRIDENFLSAISHLQTENALLGLRNDDLKRMNDALDSKIRDFCQKQLIHECSQTDLVMKEFFQVSDTAQVILMENDLKNEWAIKRHIGVQVSSILKSEDHYDLMIKKRPRFNLETRNAESFIEDLPDIQVDDIQETSERISTIHARPGVGENMIDALVYTMIGSWFQKYNKSGKNPKLRYFWVNPYSRTLHWAKTSPSQGNPRSATRIVPINSVTWNEETQTHKNYSPAEIDSLEIMTTNRIIKAQPLNWADRDLWISGLTVLLKRSNEKSLTEEAANEVSQVKPWADNQSLTGSLNSSIGQRSSLGPRSLHSSPRKSISHRRSMTIIAKEETPKKTKFTFNAM